MCDAVSPHSMSPIPLHDCTHYHTYPLSATTTDNFFIFDIFVTFLTPYSSHQYYQYHIISEIRAIVSFPVSHNMTGIDWLDVFQIMCCTTKHFLLLNK